MVGGLGCNLVLGNEVVVLWFVVRGQPVYYLWVEVIGDLLVSSISTECWLYQIQGQKFETSIKISREEFAK